MPRATNNALRAEKNAETNKPIWLYRISIDGNVANDLFLAEYDEDVSYFKDTSTVQVYTAFPITHDVVTANTAGTVDQLQVRVGNVNRVMSAHIEANGGLRTRKVTIRKVYSDEIADSSAYLEDIFFVDSTSVGEREATFTLSTDLNILNVELPGRRYTRNRCAWTYKEFGCWIDDGGGGWNSPAGFSTTAGTPLFGSTPKYATDANEETVVLNIQAKEALGYARQADHFLTIDVYADPVANLQAGSYIFISSDGTETNGWKITDLTGLGINDAAWTTLNIATNLFSVVGTGLVVSSINYIKIFANASAPMTSFGARSLFARMDSSSFFPEGADTCELTFAECHRHNNPGRFGAFLSIPWKPIFRV